MEYEVKGSQRDKGSDLNQT